MSDLREKQPEARTIDMTLHTAGSYVWGALIEVWAYSSIKNEDVYSRKVTIRFRADECRDAHGFAQCISTTISLAHDVWQTNIFKLWCEGMGQ